jgi:RES domain-containing protein
LHAVRLWRISDFADLSGQGGLLASARWHSRGRRIVYLADHPAAALVEVLVHLEIAAADLPDAFRLLAVDAAQDVAFQTARSVDLPAGWQQNSSWTRAVGDRWLGEGRTALLQVPSAIVPAASNWLLNPGHGDANRITIAEAIEAPFDPRLARRPRSAETPSAPARARPARGRSPRPSGGSGHRRSRR